MHTKCASLVTVYYDVIYRPGFCDEDADDAGACDVDVTSTDRDMVSVACDTYDAIVVVGGGDDTEPLCEPRTPADVGGGDDTEPLCEPRAPADDVDLLVRLSDDVNVDDRYFSPVDGVDSSGRVLAPRWTTVGCEGGSGCDDERR